MMVDWNEANAPLFIPKNLSYEDYFNGHCVRSLLYDALQLCETSAAYRRYFSGKDNVIQKRSQQKRSSHKLSDNGRKRSIAETISVRETLVALDLAVRYSRSRPRLNIRDVKMESKWKSLDETVNNHEQLSKQVKEYKTLTPTSPSCLSESSTVFSDDYTQMTDCGDMSDLEFRSGSGSFSGDDCDSTLAQSDVSSIDTMSNDLDRVTLDFNSEAPIEADYTSNNGKDFKLSKQRSFQSDDRENIRILLKEGISKMIEGSFSSPGNSGSNPGADFFEDREFDFLKTEAVKRSTSLKTYKTPPGTPGRKKAVRFADALGLDLEDVRHILNLEDPPHIPASAMKDLQVGIQEAHKAEGTRYLSACFPQPGASPTFTSRVRDEKVVLENCIVNDADRTVCGTVRVANIAYHKTVVVRYTTNKWTTFTDVKCSYVHNSCDGPTDRFSFTINVPADFIVGSKLEFAIMYRADGNEFWDSNTGRNYLIECYARAVPVSESDNTWLHFM